METTPSLTEAEIEEATYALQAAAIVATIEAAIQDALDAQATILELGSDWTLQAGLWLPGTSSV